MYSPLLLIGIFATFLLLPFEHARIFLFGIPIYGIEIGVLVVAILAWFASRHQSKVLPKTCEIPVPPRTLRNSLLLGIFLLLFGIISSVLAALSSHSVCPLSQEGFFRALGIVKSWFLFPMLFGYILFFVSHTHFSREKLIFLFMVSFLPFGILSLLMWIFGSGMTYDGRFEGNFNSPNALAMYLTPAVILSWYFLRTEKPKKLSPPSLFLAPFSLFFFLLVLTHSYSAWIAVGAGISVFEYLAQNLRERTRTHSVLRYVVIFIAFGGIVFLSQWNNPRFNHFLDPNSRSSFASRLMIWKSAEKMLIDSPFFGIGPGNFQNCYLSYQRYFPPYLEWSVPEPHNIFLAFWLGSGITGLFGFGFLVLWWFRNALQRIQKEGDALLLALAAIMLAMLIHGLVDTSYWRLGLSYVFWLVFFMGIREKK